MLLKTIIFACIACCCAGQVGHPCKLNNGHYGNCHQFYDCPGIHAEIQKGNRPPICGFDGNIPIICCSIEDRFATDTKSQEFCNNYINDGNIIYKGEPSVLDEFPHLAALGYGNDENIIWGCGGALISFKHILTAAHCVNTKIGAVKFARLGELKLFTKNFKVIKSTKHPKYEPPSKYHDIAILEIETSINKSNSITPACLHISRTIESENLIATGWKMSDSLKGNSNHLQKIVLNLFPFSDCLKEYKNGSKKNVDEAIVDHFQICAFQEDGDICQGDFSGPLQTKILLNGNAWTIVGVTSFGKTCGIKKSPGIYTRVSSYIKWIDSVIFSN